MLIVACGMFIESCGGGSGNVGKDIGKNEYLGNLPNLVYQHNLINDNRNAEKDAKLEKLNTGSKSDYEKAVKIAKKFDVRQEEDRKKFEAEVEKIKTELMGKDIPYEVEEGLGYEVLSCKIVNVDDRVAVCTEFELKITDAKLAKIKGYGEPDVYVVVQEIDKDGNQISDDGGLYVKLSGKTDGSTGKRENYIYVSWKNAEQMVNFAKIKFVKEK